MTDPDHDLIKMLELTTVVTDAFQGVGTGGETTTRIFGGHVIASVKSGLSDLRGASMPFLKRLFHPSRRSGRACDLSR